VNIEKKLYGGKGFVIIEDVTPSEIPEGFNSRDAVIANDAKICTNTEALKDNIEVYKFLEKLFEWGHYSPFEQAVLKFRIKAPYVVWSQIDRHRSFIYSSQLRRSGRYAKFTVDEFYIPEYLSSYSSWIEGEESSKETLENIVDKALFNYEEMLQAGVPKESARFVLPAFCLMYEDLVTVNLKNLFHFLALRTDKRAQREIRELADGMMELTRTLFPYSIKIFSENIKPVNYDFNEI